MSEFSGSDITILLVDDNSNVRLPLKAILELFGGYTVLTASSGHQALELYDHNADAIKVVVTDMAMPKMSGAELIESLYKRNSDIKIICLSGHPWEESNLISVPVSHEWLSKPVDGQVLIAVIEKLL